MLRLLLQRAGFSVLSLLLVSLILFVLTRAIPTSPARMVLGFDATEAQIAQVRGRARPRPPSPRRNTSIGCESSRSQGDLGKSLVTGLDMNRRIAETLPITIELVVLAFAFSARRLGGARHPLGPARGHAGRSARAHLRGPGSISSGLLAGAAADPLVRRRAAVVSTGRSRPALGRVRRRISIQWSCRLSHSASSTRRSCRRMTRSSLLDVLGQDYMRTGTGDRPQSPGSCSSTR